MVASYQPLLLWFLVWLLFLFLDDLVKNQVAADLGRQTDRKSVNFNPTVPTFHHHTGSELRYSTRTNSTLEGPATRQKYCGSKSIADPAFSLTSPA